MVEAMTVALIIDGWRIENWENAVRKVAPSRRVNVWPDRMEDADEVRYALVWRPPHNSLASLPHLEVIFNLGAGVDHILADPTLPDLPLVRVVLDDMTMRMSEYVVWQVLYHHRQGPFMAANQQKGLWQPMDQWAASAMRVGIMGLGALGEDAARKLAVLGFQVNGWSRSPKSIEGITCYSGADGLDDFLARTDILVVLLPLTADTRGILNAGLFRKLAKDGPLGGPVVINAGRGGLQVEADIFKCLETGDLHAVSLDVFEHEPLPASSPLWHHPGVTLTPHIAGDSDPRSIVSYIFAQIARYEAGEPLANVIDRARGY
jgi:glyoxylate/hydroxypyruvate reductase A